jgi:transposase
MRDPLNDRGGRDADKGRGFQARPLTAYTPVVAGRFQYQLDYVIGVDPHRDTHALAIVDVRTGGVEFETSVSASSSGYARVLELAKEHAPRRRAFAIEGTGSFGAGLTRFLAKHDERVLEVRRLRRERRSGGKTDALDAVRAARSVPRRPSQPSRALAANEKRFAR